VSIELLELGAAVLGGLIDEVVRQKSRLARSGVGN
jgi:hypothetical protein